jgi:hypothetical protein
MKLVQCGMLETGEEREPSVPMRRPLLTLIGSVLVLGSITAGILAYMIACPDYPVTQRTEIPSVPAPPGIIGIAQNRLFLPTPELNDQRVRFKTTMSVPELLDFYTGHLLEEGWESSSIYSSDMMLVINKQACSFYGLQISARQQSNVTEVEIDPYLNDQCECD